MNQQLPLQLQLRPSQQLKNFIAGPNADLLAALQRQLQDNGEPLIFVAGGRGQGRTHLLLGQCESAESQNSSAVYIPLSEPHKLAPEMLEGLETFDLLTIDDVQGIAGISAWESALFALFNRARDRGSRLLISANCGPGALAVKLPDLRSRLTWGLSYQLRPLNDLQQHQLLISLAQRRGLTLDENVARYLLQRTQRDTHSLQQLLQQLDRKSLTEQRRLTIPFVREQLNHN